MSTDEETWFFLSLLEHYAAHRDVSAAVVLREWDEHNITDEIFDMYFLYHQERLENAYEDIESLMATGKHVR